jgi:hypothetical protein
MGKEQAAGRCSDGKGTGSWEMYWWEDNIKMYLQGKICGLDSRAHNRGEQWAEVNMVMNILVTQEKELFE